jgi:hypothetical protein
VKKRPVSWLAASMPGTFPLGGICRSYSAHSSGDCSGFSPDSRNLLPCSGCVLCSRYRTTGGRSTRGCRRPPCIRARLLIGSGHVDYHPLQGAHT